MNAAAVQSSAPPPPRRPPPAGASGITVDPFTTAALRAAYSAPERPRDWMRQLARRLGCQPVTVRLQAAAIGLIAERRPSRPWSDAELDILINTAHLPLGSARRCLATAGYERSAFQIQCERRRKRLGLREARTAAGILTAEQLGTILGVSGSVVARWCRMGLLTAKRAKGADDTWRIRTADARDLISRRPDLVDLHRVDRDAFIHLLTSA